MQTNHKRIRVDIRSGEVDFKTKVYEGMFHN